MIDKASETAPTVQTHEEFQSFLVLLAEDYKANGKEWENAEVGSFLEALAAYSKKTLTDIIKIQISRWIYQFPVGEYLPRCCAGLVSMNNLHNCHAPQL